MISDALKRVYASAPVDDHYIECITISHPNLAFTEQDLTNEFGGVTATLEDGSTQKTFSYFPFSIIPPRAAEESALSLQVVMDNVGRALIDELEAAALDPTEPLHFTYRVYLASDLTAPANDPPLNLDITSVTVTNTVVSFTAGTTNLRSRPFPSELYTVEAFPGLSR